MQRADRLAVSGSAAAADKHGGTLIIDEAGHLVKGLKRHILATGDMALSVFLRCSDIQQDSAGSGLIIFYTLVHVGAFQKIEESHA